MDPTFTVGLAHTSNTMTSESEAVVENVQVVSAADLRLYATVPVQIQAPSTLLTVGATMQLSTTGAAGTEVLVYSSSDETIATVTAQGLVTSKKAGAVTIQVKALYNGGERPDRGSDLLHLLVYNQLSDLASSNAALNKPASAYDPSGTNVLVPNHPIANGVDGDLNTVISAAGSYAWLYRVDLGTLVTAQSVAVQFHIYNYATDYEILSQPMA